MHVSAEVSTPLLVPVFQVDIMILMKVYQSKVKDDIKSRPQPDPGIQASST